MPILKATFFFEQSGYGWTETFYRNAVGDNIADYIGEARTLALKRMPMCGAQTTMKAIRLSYQGVFRDVYGEFVNYAGTAAQPSDAPATSLSTLCQNQNRTRSKFVYLRGVWDAVVTVGGFYTPTTAFTALFNAWKAELFNKEWCWMGVATSVTKLITGVVQNPDKTVHVTLDGDLFPGVLPQYQQVRFSGVGGAVQLNGLFVAKVTTQSVFDTKFPIAIFPWTVGGQVRYNSMMLQPIVHAFVDKVSERKPGKPGFLSPGRRRARRRV